MLELCSHPFHIQKAALFARRVPQKRGRNPPANLLMGNDNQGFRQSLGTSKVLDARRRGAPTEAYRQYAARRSDRRTTQQMAA
jgi:hypothetical protein